MMLFLRNGKEEEDGDKLGRECFDKRRDVEPVRGRAYTLRCMRGHSMYRFCWVGSQPICKKKVIMRPEA
jgi:hypothetical protein